MRRWLPPQCGLCLLSLMAAVLTQAPQALDNKVGSRGCKPVYLTLDTGHMVAPLMADILARTEVKVTFFAANRRTKTGDGSLGRQWAPWWKAIPPEEHEFASHTWDHPGWRYDVAGSLPQFKVRPSAGPSREQRLHLDCAPVLRRNCEVWWNQPRRSYR
jgi:peptidoglycan/xylan/chitin deacetylase (PgdA/CDA1 family)